MIWKHSWEKCMNSRGEYFEGDKDGQSVLSIIKNKTLIFNYFLNRPRNRLFIFRDSEIVILTKINSNQFLP